jgi:hypothetical protein
MWGLLWSLTQVCSGHGVCLGISGYCSCHTGYAGSSCSACAANFARVGRSATASCVFLPGAMATCSDGIRNGNEEGVDCGGPQCTAPCAVQANSHARKVRCLDIDDDARWQDNCERGLLWENDVSQSEVARWYGDTSCPASNPNNYFLQYVCAGRVNLSQWLS